MSAIELLEKAAGHLKDRAATYDKPEGERSMGATVAAFEAVTGHQLTEEQGWLFMALLKAVRTQQGNYRADNYEDGAAYFALMGEAACEERNGGWTPQEIEAAAFKNAYKEYTLQEVIGDAVLSDLARWVVVTRCGMVVMCELEPVPHEDSLQWDFRGGYAQINKVAPPLNFKNCIWRIKK